MTFDPTPGQTMAQANSRALRESGNGWRGPQFENPTFAAKEPVDFPHDCGLVCGNCGGPSKRIGSQQRQCIKCAARWATSAKTAEELAIEKLRAVEAAKR
jgi:hypothetical protein